MSSPAVDQRGTGDRSLGDFQTPPRLADQVWMSLDVRGVTTIVEPTVGVGSFIHAAPDCAMRARWYAYDINSEYVSVARQQAADRGVSEIVTRTLSAFDLAPADFPDVGSGSVVLVIGNPPWVTNAAQGFHRSGNVPGKTNRFRLTGLDALTGKSNFDIAEAVLHAVLSALRNAGEIRVALLLKRSVALKIARDFMSQPGTKSLKFSNIDARQWFGAAVESGLFEMTLQPRSPASTAVISLRQRIGASHDQTAGLIDGKFVTDIDAYGLAGHVEAEAGAGLMWRQGIKHDAARILELHESDVGLTNGLGERVDVEREVLCPLYKSSDIAGGRQARRLFPLYQLDLSGPAFELASRWPKLALYLENHRDVLDARKSRIYARKPPFMLFGVGPYTSAPFKVAVSGLYKMPHFSVIGPSEHGAPPLVDDTCYLLPCKTSDEAVELAEYLNGADVQSFLMSIVDFTAKRPYTADVLRRIKAPGERVEPPARLF